MRLLSNAFIVVAALFFIWYWAAAVLTTKLTPGEEALTPLLHCLLQLLPFITIFFFFLIAFSQRLSGLERKTEHEIRAVPCRITTRGNQPRWLQSWEPTPLSPSPPPPSGWQRRSRTPGGHGGPLRPQPARGAAGGAGYPLPPPRKASSCPRRVLVGAGLRGERSPRSPPPGWGSTAASPRGEPVGAPGPAPLLCPGTADAAALPEHLWRGPVLQGAEPPGPSPRR